MKNIFKWCFIIFMFLFYGVSCRERLYICECTTKILDANGGQSTVINEERIEIRSTQRDKADVTCSQNEISKNAANGLNERTTCILKEG